jgi:predicted aldo/keto reductase-like oxidoreductase
MPCPAKVNILGYFTVVYNDHSIFDGTPETKERYKFTYNFRIGAKALASKCVECGKCESHCPQNIAIRKELKNVKELFK